ncbi:MAG: S8 family serine peptidase [Myxococcaceae bacterium]
MPFLLTLALLGAAPKIAHAPPSWPHRAVVLVNDPAALEQPGVKLVHRLGALGGAVVEIDRAAWDLLATDPRVRSVEGDQLGHVRDDEAWALTGLDVAKATWGDVGRGVRIAVLDTGVDVDHPDLDGGVVLQKCFVTGGCPPMNTDVGDLAPDTSGHGTHIVGSITGDGLIAPVGAAPASEVIVIRVFDDQLVGRVSDWVAALDWVYAVHVEQRITLVNMSLGTDFSFGDDCEAQQPALTEAIGKLRAAGVTVLAASGNESVDGGINAPACVDQALAVGAVYDSNLGREPDNGTYSSGCFDQDADAGRVICFSNSSTRVDLLAPGSRIRSTVPGGGVGDRRGTSQATGVATGLAAVLVGADPLLGPDSIEAIFEQTGVPTFDAKTGLTTPRIDVKAALERVRATQCQRRVERAACEVSRSCDADAGTCASVAGQCVAGACVIALPNEPGRYRAAGCSSSNHPGGVVALTLGLAAFLFAVRRRKK